MSNNKYTSESITESTANLITEVGSAMGGVKLNIDISFDTSDGALMIQSKDANIKTIKAELAQNPQIVRRPGGKADSISIVFQVSLMGGEGGKQLWAYRRDDPLFGKTADLDAGETKPMERVTLGGKNISYIHTYSPGLSYMLQLFIPVKKGICHLDAEDARGGIWKYPKSPDADPRDLFHSSKKVVQDISDSDFEFESILGGKGFQFNLTGDLYVFDSKSPGWGQHGGGGEFVKIEGLGSVAVEKFGEKYTIPPEFSPMRFDSEKVDLDMAKKYGGLIPKEAEEAFRPDENGQTLKYFFYKDPKKVERVQKLIKSKMAELDMLDPIVTAMSLSVLTPLKYLSRESS